MITGTQIRSNMVVEIMRRMTPEEFNAVEINSCYAKSRCNALMFAALENNAALADLCIKHPNVDVNYVPVGGISILMTACARNFHAVVRSLLAHPGLEVNAINKGCTALAIAIASDAPECFDLLVKDKRIDLSLQLSISAAMYEEEREGERNDEPVNTTYLSLAIGCEFAHAIKFFLTHPDRDNAIQKSLEYLAPNAYPEDVSSATKQVVTLYCAILCDFNRLARKVLEGSDMNLNLEFMGKTPLFLCVERGRAVILPLLLECGPAKGFVVTQSLIELAEDNGHDYCALILRSYLLSQSE